MKLTEFLNSRWTVWIGSFFIALAIVIGLRDVSVRLENKLSDYIERQEFQVALTVQNAFEGVDPDVYYTVVTRETHEGIWRLEVRSADDFTKVKPICEASGDGSYEVGKIPTVIKPLIAWMLDGAECNLPPGNYFLYLQHRVRDLQDNKKVYETFSEPFTIYPKEVL